MSVEIKCSICGTPSTSLLEYKCSQCGQPQDIKPVSSFRKEKIEKNEFSLWRYRQFFSYVKKEDIITLGEGWTPLVRFSRSLSYKMENQNPTGSFKDRGSTTLVSAIYRLVNKGKGFLSEDSSGNAGASIAAYSARAGIKARIYVPENVSGPKLNQTSFYGAEIRKILGSRNDVAKEAQKPEDGKFYAGHILHPLFRDGVRSLAYEIMEQLGWQIPTNIFVPVSAGTLLLGIVNGLQHLKNSGVIDAIPKIVACQTSQVSPLYHLFSNKPYRTPKHVTSVADALISVNPPLLHLMAKSLKEAEGSVEIVNEHETIRSFKELAKKGFFVEPSSAVAHAAYKRQIQKRVISGEEETVVVLTGSGLKTNSNP